MLLHLFQEQGYLVLAYFVQEAVCLLQLCHASLNGLSSWLETMAAAPGKAGELEDTRYPTGMWETSCGTFMKTYGPDVNKSSGLFPVLF